MASEDEEFEPLIPEPPDGSGPFSVGAVDPLVYRMDDTSPELRAAASYIPVAPKLTIRDAAPVAPQSRKHEAWTPGGESTELVEAKPAISPVGKSVRSAVGFLMIFVPILAIAGLVWWFGALYQK